MQILSNNPLNLIISLFLTISACCSNVSIFLPFKHSLRTDITKVSPASVDHHIPSLQTTVLIPPSHHVTKVQRVDNEVLSVNVSIVFGVLCTTRSWRFI